MHGNREEVPPFYFCSTIFLNLILNLCDYSAYMLSLQETQQLIGEATCYGKMSFTFKSQMAEEQELKT